MKKLILGLNIALLSLLVISCADKTPGVEGKPGTDGEIKTVQIDTQLWMAENMAVIKDVKGDTLIADSNYMVENGEYYYDWNTAQRICPDGWHLPTKDELKTLVNAAGFESGAELAGQKEAWKADEKDLTTSEHFGRTKFNALPVGYHYNDPANAQNGKSKLYGKSYNANFWSSTEGEKNADPKKDNSNRANCLSITSSSMDASIGMVSKEFKMSVRCIRDKK